MANTAANSQKYVLGHQGDVQFMQIDTLPEGLKKSPKTFFAKSERSGHVHALCGDYELYVDSEEPNTFYVKVGKDGAVLNHTLFEHTHLEGFFDKPVAVRVADHRPSFFTPGIYKVSIQRRVNPFSGVFEPVQD